MPVLSPIIHSRALLLVECCLEAIRHRIAVAAHLPLDHHASPFQPLPGSLLGFELVAERVSQ